MTTQPNVPVVDNWEDLLCSDTDEVTSNLINNKESLSKPNHTEKSAICEPSLGRYEEQRKCQKLVEQMDENTMDDLFDGFVISQNNPEKISGNGASQVTSNINHQQDVFNNLNLNSYGKVESTAFKIAECIKPALAKSPAWLRFIDICLNEVFQKLDIKDLKTLKKKVDQQLLVREKEEREKSSQKKKPNDILSLSRNYKEELDIFDGVDSLDESDDY
ncbi:translation initiation factor eif3 subunit [Cryptosporidium felis]|nr:translation initiation factor eif3 subunit [Cryptosporidium felis]